MRKILPILKNKYFLTGVFFVVWIFFFDSNRLLSTFRYKKELYNVEKERDYYLNEITTNKSLLQLYKTNKKALAKFAREKYMMKKDNEDIFLIVEEESK